MKHTKLTKFIAFVALTLASSPLLAATCSGPLGFFTSFSNNDYYENNGVVVKVNGTSTNIVLTATNMDSYPYTFNVNGTTNGTVTMASDEVSASYTFTATCSNGKAVFTMGSATSSPSNQTKACMSLGVGSNNEQQLNFNLATPVSNIKCP